MSKVKNSASALGEVGKIYARRGSFVLERHTRAVSFRCGKCDSIKKAKLAAFNVRYFTRANMQWLLWQDTFVWQYMSSDA